MDQAEHADRQHVVNGKLLFVLTLGGAVVLSVGALLAGVVAAQASLWVGLGAGAVWGIWLVVLLYLAGGAISRRQHAGEAATSILLALLLTPLVLSAPVMAVAGSVGSSLGEAFVPGAVDEDALLGGTDVLPSFEEEEQPLGVASTEEEVERNHLPDGVTRADLSEEEWTSFYECVTLGDYPDECPVGDNGY